MKRVFLMWVVIAGISLASLPVTAQNRQKRDGQHMKELNLTEDQKTKIKALNEDYKAKMKNLAMERKTGMNQVLTPDQQKQMKDFRQARQKNFDKNKRNFAHNRQGKHANRLDADSRAKIKDLREAYKKELGAIEKSRIAPEMQVKQKQELRGKLRNDIREVKKNAMNKKQGVNPS